MSKESNDKMYELMAKHLTAKDIERTNRQVKIQVWFLKLKLKMIEKFKKKDKQHNSSVKRFKDNGYNPIRFCGDYYFIRHFSKNHKRFSTYRLRKIRAEKCEKIRAFTRY